MPTLVPLESLSFAVRYFLLSILLSFSSLPPPLRLFIPFLLSYGRFSLSEDSTPFDEERFTLSKIHV